MTLAETIVAVVTASAAFKTAAADRIFAVNLPASTLAPFVVFNLITGETFPAHNDAATDPVGDLRTTQVQFSAYGITRAEAQSLSDALHSAIHLGQSATRYRIIEMNGPRTSKETDLHRCDIDLTFGHSLPV